MAEFQIKAGDTAPPFKGRCLDAKGAAIPTLGTVVRFRMKPRTAGLRAPIDQLAAWTNTTTAEASYAWQTGDTAVPGLYDAEFHVTYVDGRSETFPNGEYVTVEILAAA